MSVAFWSSMALLLLGTSAGSQDPHEVPSPMSQPTPRRRIDIEGWQIHVEEALFEKHPATAEAALEELRVQLYHLRRSVGKEPLSKLRSVPIFLGIEDEHGKHPCACYHPSREWLRTNGYDPAKAGAVDIANAQTFLAWTHAQPWMVMHELAHAYHHQVLGHDQAELIAAFQAAVESKRYEDVLHISGRQQRHYALTNVQEYFAESTEAYFGTNDFEPFVRAELQRFDPTAFALLKKIWGTRAN